jgi:integrase/recombinase XerD
MNDVEFFEPSEIVKILDSTTNERHRLQILLMSDAGLRVSECTNLRWSDCDFKKRLLTTNTLKQKDKEESRTIPMSSRLYEAFAKLIEKTKTNDLRGYIFANADGEPVGRQAVNNMLKDIQAKNPSLGNVYPHRLRHSFATNLRANGAELHDIRDLLGHDKVETSLIYAHGNANQLREKIEGKQKKSLLKRLVSWLVPAKRPTQINLTFVDSSFVIGRNDELLQIENHMAKGLHVVLVGSRGIGKTHILESLKFPKRVIELDNTKDFKKSLLNIILWLFNDDKESAAAMITGTRDSKKWATKMSTESLQNLITIIRGIVEKHEYILKIGDIDDITPTVAKGLEQLKEHFQIITTSQKLKPNVFGFISNFEKVELKPLDRTNTLKMFHRLTEDLHIENIEFTKNKIWEVSEGLPKTVFEIAERMRKEPVLTGDVVEDICNNYLGRSVREIDLSMFLILVFGGLMVYKFILRSSGDVDARAIGGLITIILLFGRFFVSRGRRQSL